MENKDKLVSNAPSVSFKDVHPSQTGGKNPRVDGVDLPAYGNSDGKESAYTRCVHCGFIFRPDRHPRGSGYGNERRDAISGETATKDPVVTAGCPFCGSSNYDGRV